MKVLLLALGLLVGTGSIQTARADTCAEGYACSNANDPEKNRFYDAMSECKKECAGGTCKFERNHMCELDDECKVQKSKEACEDIGVCDWKSRTTGKGSKKVKEFFCDNADY